MNQAIVIVSFGTADSEAKASCLDAVAADGIAQGTVGGRMRLSLLQGAQHFGSQVGLGMKTLSSPGQ